MITDLSISYSWWAVLLVVVIGLLYAGLLYIKNPLNKLTGIMSVTLFIFRFIAVFLLGFLLLSPTIKTKKKQIEKPIIIIGQDNSRSVLMTKDSSYYTDMVASDMSSLITKLSEENDVESYLFGEIVAEGSTPEFTDNKSNYSAFFTHIKKNYTGLNVGAIILTGDGIVNNGTDPVYAASDINYPIFTIALGDTSQSRDIKIDDVRYNSIVYSGDIFPIEVSISASKVKGFTTTVKLLENNKVVSKKTIKFPNDNFRTSINFDVEANKAGKRRYSILVEPVNNEISVENNLKNVFIDVLDTRKKILILAYAPHPDIGVIKQSLAKNINYEVETDYIGSFNEDISNFDLVILHQLPAKKNSAIRILRKLDDQKVPTLFILGKESNLPVFNQFFKGLNILSAVGNMVPAQFEYNSLFTYFSFNKEFVSQLSNLPPLNVPLGNYSLSVAAEVFAWQMIDGILTDFPLITFHNNMGLKSGVIGGEGIWLWRIQSYLQYGNSVSVDALLNKIAMFLIADTDRRHFKIQTRGEYDSHEDVVIVAELYNQALEPVNSAEVVLTLKNEKGEKFNFIFTTFDDYYKLNINKLPVGIYSYNANVKLGAEVYNDRGEFIVQQLDNESRNLNANHRILKQLATEHNGQMYYPNEIDSLLTDIENLDSITSKIHYEDKFTGLNSIIYVLLGIILLLFVEWFLRKYFGNY
ncbi:MAG: hypothetical protein QM503_13260 [Bacteroidota bacterium]